MVLGILSSETYMYVIISTNVEKYEMGFTWKCYETMISNVFHVFNICHSHVESQRKRQVNLQAI